MRQVSRRKKRNRPVRAGWDLLLSDPVPGDVLACLDELQIPYERVVEEEAQGRCPAHEERTGKADRHPSWSVNVDSGEHNCFSCGFRGPFTTLVRWALDCSHDDAVLWIRARGSIERARRTLQGGYINELAEEREEVTEADLALYTEVPEWACEERDLDPTAVDHYGILWDPEMEAWITPIRDPYTSKLWGWQEKNERYFRNRPDDVKKSQTLFGINQLDLHAERAILVESPLDVPRLRTAGIDGGVAAFGVRVSDLQMSLLLARVTTLIVALDNDRDGARASDTLRKRFGHRVRMRFLNYADTDAKDVGEMDDEQIREAIATAYSSVLARF